MKVGNKKARKDTTTAKQKEEKEPKLEKARTGRRNKMRRKQRKQKKLTGMYKERGKKTKVG